MAPADPRALLSEALLLCGRLRPGTEHDDLRATILARLAPLGGAVAVCVPADLAALCERHALHEIRRRLRAATFGRCRVCGGPAEPPTRRAQPVPANDNARAS